MKTSRMAMLAVALAAATGADALARDVSWWSQAELTRVEQGRPQAAAALWEGAARDPNGAETAAARERALWWSLPPAAAARGEVLDRIDGLPGSQADRPWTRVLRLYAAAERGDAKRLAAEARALRNTPDDFPSHAGDRLALEALLDGGTPRADALLRVIAARDDAPLYALRDLDEALTREALAAGQRGEKETAGALTDTRNRLRDAYACSARRIVERLFALDLQGKTAERDALFAHAHALPYLWRADALRNAAAALSPEDAERLLLGPLFRGELAFLDTPPALPAAAAPPATAPLTIRAGKTVVQGQTTVFSGGVRAELAPLTIECDELTTSPAEPSRVTGHGRVAVRGLRGFESGARADMFGLSTADLTLRLTGAVALTRPDGSVLKTEDCTLDARGNVLRTHSLLDDFAAETNVLRRIELLPRIAARYTPDELPDEARYLAALRLIEPHLTWHVRVLPPPDVRPRAIWDKALMADYDLPLDTPWQEAHAGESWMRERAAAAITEACRAEETRREQWENELRGARQRPDRRAMDATAYWRLKDPRHPDVRRAIDLLRSIKEKTVLSAARRWVAELERNNTVLTFDVPSAVGAGAIVADLRAVDTVRFELHRVAGPDILARVCSRIGKDFVFREFQPEALQDSMNALPQQAARMSVANRLQRALEMPVFGADTLVAAWSADAQTLPQLKGEWSMRLRDSFPGWSHDYGFGWWAEQPDAWYYGDENEEHRERLDYNYLPGFGTPSSWKASRIVELPKAASQPGAYVLVAEANGVKAYVPLLADPLQMTLGRCRDGVLAAVSSSRHDAPVKGAAFASSAPLFNAPVSDADGVAFLKLAAVGDAAIVAGKDGRYAVGGFGRVFEGIYATRYWWLPRQLKILDVAQSAGWARVFEPAPATYEDRYVMAAYTDRPTYRPGQEVNFKLIVRRRPPNDKPVEVRRGDVTAFRAEDFDFAATLAVPPAGDPIPCEVISPRGHVVSTVALTCNDFGTAAGAFTLNAESAVGPYALRVKLDGMDHVLPEVFAVRYYRRPNFSVTLDNAPTNLVCGSSLSLAVAADYYFGMPVAGAAVRLQLATADIWRPYETVEARLDEKGRCSANMRVPADLPPGDYVLVATVTDESGRGVSALRQCRHAVPAARATGDTRALPLYVRAGTTLTVPSQGKEVQHTSPGGEPRRIATEKGTARIELAKSGWHTIETDDFQERVFAYGGPEKQGEKVKGKHEAAPLDRWVNLADYAHFDPTGEDCPAASNDSYWGYPNAPRVPPPSRVLALFDRRRARVGEELELLVWLPDVAGKARVMFTYEGRTVADYRVVELPASDSPYHVVKLPITARHAPNFYLQAHVLTDSADKPQKQAVQAQQKALRDRELAPVEDAFADGSEDPLWCRVDVLADDSALPPEALHVTASPDRREYKPGERVTVAMDVRDADGRPCEAELSLSAVDESVYTFGEGRERSVAAAFASAHPSRRFQPKAWRVSLPPRQMDGAAVQELRALQEAQQAMQAADKAQQLAESSRSLLPARPELPVPVSAIAGLLPLAGLEPARLRADFRETAAWLPQIRADRSGRAEAAFTLPDSLTRFRLTALAVTRDTRLGVATTNLTASLPVSVQLFLPRFAVEKDDLAAVAVAHNATASDQRLALACTVRGAELAAGALGPGWSLDNGSTNAARTEISVPAGGHTSVKIPLLCRAAGRVTLRVEASNLAHADSEERSLEVRPLGRPARHILEGNIQRETDARLPDGFRPEKFSVRVTPAGEFTPYDALTGLDQLVDYPYGCVEQTMSRFLPAVMVQDAIRRRALDISSAALDRLPDVLAKGLDRLYTFQHEDGGWGWWDKDQKDAGMTLYVLYGLTRCRLAGRDVNTNALDRGYALIEKWLDQKLLRENADDTVMGRAQLSRAWHVLALAGRGDRAKLTLFAGKAGAGAGAEALLNLTLACHAAGLRPEAHRVWEIARTVPAQSLAEKALLLQAQVRMGEPPAVCLATAREIAGDRKGNDWGSTRDTSWAIEALAEALPILPPPGDKPLALEVELDGKSILRAAPAERDLRQGAVFETTLMREALAGKMAPVIRFRSTNPRLMRYAITAEGVDELDLQAERGDTIRCRQIFTAQGGGAVAGPVAQGELVTGSVTLTLSEAQPYVIVEAPRPAGFEYPHERLGGPLAAQAAHVEFRDDRISVFFSRLEAGEHRFTYLLRAETVGASHVLPAEAYPMYNDRVRGSSAATVLTVAPRQ